jgi:hypothetical protein
MTRIVPVLTVCLASALVVGCGKPSAQPNSPTRSVAQQPSEAPSAGSPSTGVFQMGSTRLDDSPDAVVTTFLEALRDGDESLAESLLTKKAREETAKHDLAVRPPGTPSATFQIGKVHYVTADRKGAHVNSTWSEKDDAGKPTSYEVVWALRSLQEGWRIAGMATQVTDADPPVFLNFEDPDDMLRKLRDAETRLANQQDRGVRQANRPDAGGSPGLSR